MSGYHVSDSTVIGFSHTHLSGTGIGDLLDVGNACCLKARLPLAVVPPDDPTSGRWSYNCA